MGPDGGRGQILVLEFARQIDQESIWLRTADFQSRHARFQFGNTSIAVAETLTEGNDHTFKVAAAATGNCASLREVNSYFCFISGLAEAFSCRKTP